MSLHLYLYYEFTIWNKQNSKTWINLKIFQNKRYRILNNFLQCEDSLIMLNTVSSYHQWVSHHYWVVEDKKFSNYCNFSSKYWANKVFRTHRNEVIEFCTRPTHTTFKKYESLHDWVMFVILTVSSQYFFLMIRNCLTESLGIRHQTTRHTQTERLWLRWPHWCTSV